MAGGAWAFDPADLETFESTGSCPGCDLSDARLAPGWSDGVPEGAGNLRGADLSGAWFFFSPLDFDLRDADLSNASAFYTAFIGADLSGARLRGMGTYGTVFDGAILRGTDLSGTGFDASFVGADLAGADLSGASFSISAEFTQDQLDKACGDADTRLPPGLTIAAC